MRFLTALLFFIVFHNVVVAQPQSIYSQYMFNGLAINPAYAGSSESAQITALSRLQWIGLDDAPSTYTFAMHAPIKEKKIGLGITFFHDQASIFKQSGIFGSYAYKINTGNGILSFGLQGGLTSNNFGLSNLHVKDSGDPNFNGQDIKNTTLNFGAGIYYQTDKYYIGAAIPQFMDHNHEFEDGTGEDYSQQVKSLFLSGGYLFTVNPDVKLKPNFMFSMLKGSPIEYDLNMNVLFREVLWVGASVQTFNSINGLVELQLTDQLRFGYAHNFLINELKMMKHSTHEIMINYNFTFFKNSVYSPRYF